MKTLGFPYVTEEESAAIDEESGVRWGAPAGRSFLRKRNHSRRSLCGSSWPASPSTSPGVTARRLVCLSPSALNSRAARHPAKASGRGFDCVYAKKVARIVSSVRSTSTIRRRSNAVSRSFCSSIPGGPSITACPGSGFRRITYGIPMSPRGLSSSSCRAGARHGGPLLLPASGLAYQRRRRGRQWEYLSAQHDGRPQPGFFGFCLKHNYLPEKFVQRTRHVVLSSVPMKQGPIAYLLGQTITGPPSIGSSFLSQPALPRSSRFPCPCLHAGFAS